MTRRHDLERHRRGLEEIGKIVHSMQTLAFLETRKLVRRLESQQRQQALIERAAADFLAFHPCGLCAAELTPVFLLVGSERGFCGDFNEQLLRALDGAADGAPLIAVGRRLCTKLAGDDRLAAALEGATVTEEADGVLARVVEAVNRLRERHGALRLTILHHRPEPEGVTRVTLLPPFAETAAPPPLPYPPLFQLEPQEFLLGLVEHYLLSALHGILYASLMAESHRRLQQLEGAARHLERRVGELQRAGARLRQEEIVEEIEVLLLGAAGLQGAAGPRDGVRHQDPPRLRSVPPPLPQGEGERG